MSEGGGFVGVTELARRHGVTRAAIHAAIQRGALPAVKIGNSFGIPEEAAADYEPAVDAAAKGKRSGEVRRKKAAARVKPLPWEEWQKDFNLWRNAATHEIKRSFYGHSRWWQTWVHYAWTFEQLGRFKQEQWLLMEQELHALGLKPLEAVLTVRCWGPDGCRKRLAKWRMLLNKRPAGLESASELILLQATLDDWPWYGDDLASNLQRYLRSEGYMARLWAM
jgi:hypothetical protein